MNPRLRAVRRARRNRALVTVLVYVSMPIMVGLIFCLGLAALGDVVDLLTPPPSAHTTAPANPGR